jgi:hypothetical protein
LITALSNNVGGVNHIVKHSCPCTPKSAPFRLRCSNREVVRKRLDYSRGDTWDSMLHEGVHLLERFAQEDRVHIRNPRRDLQVKIIRRLSSGNDFLAYIDAIGQLDQKQSIIDWKTSSAHYPDQPAGLLALATVRSPDRDDSSHDRIQPRRHRGHMDRRRALARHLGR